MIVFSEHFWQTPQSINATLGSVVVFHCHPSTINLTVSWYLNNVYISHQNTSNDDITLNGGYTLQITAHRKFNNSAVKCIIDKQQTTSPIAILLIQGKI